jgi:Carboxypeptidase regulatory-like domain
MFRGLLSFGPLSFGPLSFGPLSSGSRRFVVSLALLGLLTASLSAQVSNATGNIQGTITDPTGAVVPEARVTILNKATGRTIDSTSTSSGVYTSGSLVPGVYTVRIEVSGFQAVELTATVQVGVTTSGNIKLQVGSSTQTVEVRGEEIRINTEQATVQGVVTRDQIETLPINGRNFLDLAQLEPGVQIQDGSGFDPTKNGFSSISFGGRFGRTARIEVDGVDISDETVGTTTQNIPAGAIEEFQIGQSSLDLSSELTSSGSVNVATQSGTNHLHGQGFYDFRDHRFAAALPGGSDSPFQRNQFGGSLGGALIKDKVFFFLDGERVKQDLSAPVLPSSPFNSLAGHFSSPFRDTEVFGKLDWQIKPDNYKFFYRFSFEQNRNVAAIIPNSFQPFANNSHTPVHAIGLDFNTGSYTHSIRVSYMKFRNGITDATSGTGIFNPAPKLELAIGNDASCLTPGADIFCSGPSFLAPQTTFQSNKQFKYDGSKTWNDHIFRFGGGFNHIQGGGTANFLGLAPEVGALAGSGPTLNDPNPLDYPAQEVVLGNGQGFGSELKAFGLPGGGLGPDNRISLYFGDTWKFRPNLTLTAGLRYQRDSGRTDSDLAPTPCSQLDPTLAANLSAAGTPCTGNILDLFGKGLGGRVRQPNLNFGPQVGVAWDPFKDGKTVVRAGAGIYYENSVWNNVLYDRPPRLAQGLFNGLQTACTGGAAQTFTLPDGTVVTPTFCGQPIGVVADQIAALQQQYQAATIAAGPAVNGGFIGNTLSSGQNFAGTSLFGPHYETPRSLQMNVGFQRQIGKDGVLTMDYLRNVATHTLLSVDVNHVGDAHFLNVANGLAAINATAQAIDPACGSAGAAGSASQAVVNCILSNFPTTSITDFANNGLDSGSFLCGGSPCPTAAFPGINPNLGVNQMLFPIGRSLYTGYQFSFKQNVANPFRGVRRMNLVASYAWSKYIATARDGDFVNPATDNAHPLQSIGPNGLDRRHQISVGGTAELPRNFRLGLISHFYSPLPLDLSVPASGNVGGIFTSDITGDGSGDGSSVSPGGDLLPGTKLGAFGRTVTSIAALDKLIGSYNLNFAGFETPAGVALLQSGLFTHDQLIRLGGVAQPIQNTQPGAVMQSWLRALDLSLAWTYKPIESVTIEPSVSVFNVFNFANFDGPNQTLNGTLDGSSGSVNGPGGHSNDRTGLGTGVFALGSPRAIEFGLKVTF